MQEKLTTIEEAISKISNGDVVALQTMATVASPMTLVRELIRQQKRELGLVVLVGGIPVDLLAAAGVINRLIGAAVTMEQFGLCQQYRQAVEQRRIRVEEISESVLNARLGAGARNLPFLPTRGAIGTDLMKENPDNMKLLDDPFGGLPVIACRALVPDVALIHAHRADRFGNIQYEPTALWPDMGIMPYAAKQVIVSVEEIVDTEVLRLNPDRTVLPGFMVDAVVEVPYGAHPTSFYPDYGYDSDFHRQWTSISRDNEKVKEFISRYVHSPANQQEYLEAIGGESVLNYIAKWEQAE
ncbi:MAG: CoA transferase subunit A [Gammaproteobacteria bacterium]|jgi:glutaconate CoA-transferase, subunit A|nr:CoA transferase subunit A [Gammaproteobacteria bacterium]